MYLVILLLLQGMEIDIFAPQIQVKSFTKNGKMEISLVGQMTFNSQIHRSFPCHNFALYGGSQGI